VGQGVPGLAYRVQRHVIHCGGIDHIPVHHTNEIAQSEAATGSQWVNYWIHAEWLLIGREKMAKSTGNLVPLAGLIEKGYDPLDYRFFCLGAHYRTQLSFTWEAMDAARTGRLGLVDRIVQFKAEAASGPEEPVDRARAYLEDFESHAADDLNMPRCLADLWTLLRDSSVPPGQKLGAAFRMDRILDLGLSEAREKEVDLDEETRRLVEEREQARKSRDFSRADQIRVLLLAKGLEIQDGPKGPRVRFAAGQRG
jgi:cysteinyl-tRNA synthetase